LQQATLTKQEILVDNMINGKQPQVRSDHVAAGDPPTQVILIDNALMASNRFAAGDPPMQVILIDNTSMVNRY
jgi:hypothetical protein